MLYTELLKSFFIMVLCSFLRLNEAESLDFRSSKSLADLLSEMTLEEKVGQLFVIPVSTAVDRSVLQHLIVDLHIGGVICKDTRAVDQISLMHDLQKIAKIPLLCLQDAEWGTGMRLTDRTPFPKNLTLGAIQEEGLLFLFGQAIGLQCREVGAHFNLCPVVDINTNPRNPIIHMRSFGDDTSEVTKRALQVMRGIQSVGVMACAKHFPGHGDTAVDSHIGLPFVIHSLERLQSVELRPFQSLIDAGVEGVMSAHLSVPSLDSDLPASLSSRVIEKILHQQMGFKGLIITDALNMRALSDRFSSEEVARLALEAGHDLLLYGDHIAPAVDHILRVQVPAAYVALVSYYREEKAPMVDLDRRVLKILQAKERITVLPQEKAFPVQLEALNQRLFNAAITLVEGKTPFMPIAADDRVGLIADPKLAVFRSVLQGEGCSLVEPTDDLTGYSRIIIALKDLSPFLENFGISPSLWNLLQTSSFEVVLFSTPYALASLAGHTVLVAYEDTLEAQRAASEVLLGRAPVLGRLPIKTTPSGSGAQGASSQ